MAASASPYVLGFSLTDALTLQVWTLIGQGSAGGPREPPRRR